MEDESQNVKMGKLIHETSYQKRNSRFVELAIENIKLDYYDPKKGVVYETKKSTRLKKVHYAQAKYYLFVLERNGIPANYAEIEYPKLRKRERIELSEEDRKEIPLWEAESERIVAKTCPALVKKSACKTCAYHDFCYINTPKL